jgi:hypothetical protein
MNNNCRNILLLFLIGLNIGLLYNYLKYNHIILIEEVKSCKDRLCIKKNI